MSSLSFTTTTFAVYTSGGAVAINLCGGGALLAYLAFGDLSLSTEGRIVLWILATVVVCLGLVELVTNLSSHRLSS